MTRATDIDAIISTWMSDGPEHAPELRSQLALDQIATTPQSRSGMWPRPSTDRGAQHPWRLLAAAAVAVVLATSIGVAVRTAFIGLPSPSPLPVASPSPSRTPVPSARPDAAREPRTAVAPDGSFEIVLPSALWTIESGQDPTALYLQHRGTEISIRAGDEDGRLIPCDAAADTWETCVAVSATTLDALAAAVGLPEEMDAVGSTTTLDEEPAVIERLDLDVPPAPAHFAYVTAVHNGRPYLLRFWQPPSGSPGGLNGDIGLLLDAFHFTDEPESSASAEIEQPESVDGFRTFVAPDRSFEVRLPDQWRVRRGPDSTALYVTDGSTAVSFRFGDESGRIRQCDETEIIGESCGMIEATSLEELGDAIALDGSRSMVHYGPNASPTTLGGEPATTISMVAGISPPWGVRYVIAVHDGRPFILRASRPRPPEATLPLLDVLDGVRFTD